MKTILKISVVVSALVVMLLADIPFLPVKLVPDADAILGVRRRTAVVASSAAHAEDAAAMAQAQQQTAAAQQQAAAAQQQAAAAKQQLPPAADCRRPAAGRRCQAAGCCSDSASAGCRCRETVAAGHRGFRPPRRVASPHRSAEWSTTTAAVTSIARCFKGNSLVYGRRNRNKEDSQGQSAAIEPKADQLLRNYYGTVEAPTSSEQAIDFTRDALHVQPTDELEEGQMNKTRRGNKWIAALMIGAMVAGLPAALLARDRGFNQPGAAGRVGGVGPGADPV